MTARAPAILVVTRREQEGRAICAELRIAGRRALLAGTGREALDLAASQPPALVVQDIVLGDMDGELMIAALRGLPGLDELPAIALAGAPPATTDDVEGPFDELLIKPVDADQLVALAGELLAPATSTRARVLLVDDDPAQRRLMTLLLARAGYQVTATAHGSEALELAGASVPDIVVSDVLMPGIDGFELARALRSDLRMQALPIVLTSSAFVGDADVELARAAGANALVVRTPELEELLATIEACLAPGAAAAGRPARRDVVERRYGERMAVHLNRQVRANAQLRARLAAQSVELAVLAELGGEISLRGADDLLAEVLARCAEVTGFGCGAVYLSAGPAAPVLQGRVGFASSEPLRDFFGAPELLMEAIAVAGGATARLPGPDFDDERVRLVLRNAGLSVVLVAPVAGEGELLGALVLGSPRPSATPDQASFLTAVAAQLGQTLARVRALNALARSQRRIVERLTRAVEFRNEETANHTQRVSRYASLLAARAGIDERRSELIAASAAMHDIGKLGVPDRILLKPGRLTGEERRQMERHAEYGRKILTGEPDALLDLAAQIAWTHHERWDGGGYPRRLGGAEIPLEGRIVAICDAFDALTSARVYRPARTVHDALGVMREARGSQFDPELLDRFLEALPRVLEIRVRHPDAAARSSQ
ncbi:MAG: HD domain-containing phosphohydrolase [Solirubrobacteraceae bacterium]